MNKLFTLSLLVVALFGSSVALAQTPTTPVISFQGTLLDASGNEFADGERDLTVLLYSSASGGDVEFSERHRVDVRGGLFTIEIGSVERIPYSVDFARQMYLGIEVNGRELEPRTKLTAVPQSMHARIADKAASLSLPSTSTIDSGSVALAIINRSEGSAISGRSTGGHAIIGTTKSGNGVKTAGVAGLNLGSGAGVFGSSNGRDGIGVEGRANDTLGRGTGLYGRSVAQNGSGVKGISTSSMGAGVIAINESSGPAIVAMNNGDGPIARFVKGYSQVAAIDGEGNLDANNMPGVAFDQQSYGDGVLPAGADKFLDTLEINVPASGYLLITTHVELTMLTSSGPGLVQLQIMHSTDGVLTSLAQTKEGFPSGGIGAHMTTATLTWVIPVEKGSIKLVNKVANGGNCSIVTDSHAMQAVYLPVKY